MSYPTVYLYDFSREDRSIESLSELLGKERYEYCANMKSKKAESCSAYAFLLLRYALRREFGMTEIPVFCYNEYEKPFLKKYPDIFFNMSHVGTTVICAVSRRPIGADIQDERKIGLRTAGKFLTESELESVSAITDENKLSDELCRLWCIKESYGKYTGKGFGEGFTSFEADKLVESGKAVFTKRDGFYISICGEW